jgi:glycosyltransferase involved in cell wall biosynthesis
MQIVLTIGHHLDPNSGSPGATMALAEAYERAGHETELLSLDDVPQGLGSAGIRLAFPLLLAGRLAGALGRWADVVDSSGGDAWLWSLRRAGRAPGPLLVTRSHGLEHREHLELLRDSREGRVKLRRRYYVYNGGERLREVAVALRRADLTFFLNPDDRDFAVQRLGVNRGRTHIIREGLPDLFIGRPAPRPGADGVRLALVARHTVGMGSEYYVPALERILLRHPSVRVSLLGSGVPASDVRGDFASAVRERIDVVPSYDRHDLPRLLDDHEILVSSKFNEGFGMALIEGMACGLVPVVAAASGPKRIVEHERTGLLVEPRSVSALVAGVERLLADPELRGRLRQNAQRSVQQYSWDAVAAERLAMIEAALDRRLAVFRASSAPGKAA